MTRNLRARLGALLVEPFICTTWLGRAMSFQITARAAAGRIGRFDTEHGRVTTPTLMPVINPNIDLVSAKEMKDLFGCEMVITNSYVIHKHDDLREHALEKGVHDLLNWDGTVMTDSGTFQMYVYGDVEVGPNEIVQFQRDMGVDVATCLDLFVTPDMTRQQAEDAVSTTLQRTRDATEHKGKSLLNATVQGGVHLDLREKCATAYRDMDVDYHTIGGVVPVMERQMYPELVDMIIRSQMALRKDRPVHLFGAGHPLIFPLATALGCDLYDSSSYAKYAKDSRIMIPEGTLKLADIEEWSFQSRFLDKWTPSELRKADKQERTRAIALHNLDVCFTDMRRIREAIRNGTLWELVEQRAAAHPLLAAATRKLGQPEYQKWLEVREPISGHSAVRYTGSLTHQRPIFHRVRERLVNRLDIRAPKVEVEVETPYAKVGEEKVELAMHKEPSSTPWSKPIGTQLDPEQEHVVLTAWGPVPLGLDESYPFSQSVLPRLDGLDPQHMGWVGDTKDAMLEAHDCVPAIPGPPGPDGGLNADELLLRRSLDYQFGKGAADALLPEGWRAERSKSTLRVRGLYLGDEHLASFRIHDGFWTLKKAGAQRLFEALPTMRVYVSDDSVPFNREGKSVFSQFVLQCDPSLRPGDECLVVDKDGELLAHGQCLMNAEEMADFQGGMAVKVRGGFAA